MKVAYVIYPDFTALDLIGQYEVISLSDRVVFDGPFMTGAGVSAGSTWRSR